MNNTKPLVSVFIICTLLAIGYIILKNYNSLKSIQESTNDSIKKDELIQITETVQFNFVPFTPESIPSKKFDWKSVEEQLSDENKHTNLIKSINNDETCFYGFYKSNIDKINCDDYCRSKESMLQDVHFIDLNNDNKNDIIINTNMMSVRSIFIYLNNGKSYKCIFKGQGDIINIWYSNILNKTVFLINNPPCCGDIRNLDELCYIENNEVKLKESRYSLSGIAVTKFPKTINKYNKFLINENETIVRNEPEIKKIEFLPEENIVAKLKKGTIAYELHRESDKSGNLWVFVLTHNNIYPIESVLLMDEQKTNPKILIYGWIKIN